MRWIMGHRGPPALAPTEAIQRELGCVPVCALVAARRCRAFLKYRTLGTWIGELVRHPSPTNAGRAWVAQTHWWVHTFLKDNIEVNRKELSQTVYPRNLSALARTHVIIQEQGIALTKVATSRSFNDANYQLLENSHLWLPALGKGLLLLRQFRTNSYWTYQRLNKARLERSPNCPYCPGTCEDEAHILCVCAKWAPLRDIYLPGVRLDVAQKGEQVVKIELLGGEGRVARWQQSPEDHLAAAEAADVILTDPTQVGAGYMLNRTWGQFSVYRVAAFLFWVDRERLKIASTHGAHGRPTFFEDIKPEGEEEHDPTGLLEESLHAVPPPVCLTKHHRGAGDTKHGITGSEISAQEH